MNAMPDLDRRVSDWLRVEASSSGSDRVLAATLDRVAVTRQDRTLTRPRFGGASGWRRAALIAATVALLVVATATAVFIGSQLLTNVVPVPAPVAPAVRTLGQGPRLEWTRLDVLPPPRIGADQTPTRVAWLGDRFVMVDEGTQTVATSPDGSTWTTLAADDPDWDYFQVMSSDDPMASWQDDIVSWRPSTPGSGVWIRRPPDAAFVAEFEGTVDAVGIGPSGIVVSSHTEFDQGAFIQSVLGPTWSFDNIAFLGLQDGVLSLGSRDGRTASINLAEHGVDASQFENRGEGWHSLNGKDWTPIPAFPGKVSSIVGTADGFVARGDSGTGPRVFHSPDGFAWQRMAIAVDGFEQQMINPIMMRWGDGALETDGTFIFESWTRAGKKVLPMAGEVRTREHPLQDAAGIGAGPLGIVCIDVVADEILFSPDGVEWRIQAMSDEMAQAGSIVRRPHATNVAVGAGAVVVLLWENTSDEGAQPSLWVGRRAT